MEVLDVVFFGLDDAHPTNMSLRIEDCCWNSRRDMLNALLDHLLYEDKSPTGSQLACYSFTTLHIELLY